LRAATMTPITVSVSDGSATAAVAACTRCAVDAPSSEKRLEGVDAFSGDAIAFSAAVLRRHGRHAKCPDEPDERGLGLGTADQESSAAAEHRLRSGGLRRVRKEKEASCHTREVLDARSSRRPQALAQAQALSQAQAQA